MADEPRRETDDADDPPENATGHESEQSAPQDPPQRKSPFKKSTVRFLEGEEAERLAVRLEADKIGEGTIATTIAGPFLNRLNELLHALAAYAQSKELGKRGPLPGLSGAAGLSLAGLPQGSVVFHFTLGEGEVDEQLLITPRSEIGSAMAQAIEYLMSLLEVAPEQDELLSQLAEFDPRIGGELAQLLDVLVAHNVATTWRQHRGESIAITAEAAAAARLALDREAELSTEEVIATGYLYEANAKEHSFRLEQPNRQGTLQGHYDDAYTDTVRGAWGQLVRAKLHITRRRLERKKQAEPDEVELVEILEIYGKPE